MQGFEREVAIVRRLLEMGEQEAQDFPWIAMGAKMFDLSFQASAEISALLFVLSPDPLEALCRSAASPPLNG